MDEPVKEFTRKLICTYLEEGDKNEEFELAMIDTLCRDQEEDLLLLCLIPPNLPMKNVFTLSLRVMVRLYEYLNPPFIPLPLSLDEIMDQCVIHGDLPLINRILHLNPNAVTRNRIILGIKHGSIEFLDRYVTFLSWYPESELLQVAIQYGRIDVLKWIHIRYFPTYSVEHSNWAIRHDQFESLKWLKEHGCPISTSAFDESMDNLEVLQWLLENTSFWCHWMFSLVRVGNLDRLKWINSLSLPINHVLSEATFAMAWRYQQIEILDWLYENNCPIDHTNLAALAKDTNLKWGRNHGINLYGKVLS